jgi:hypothetical protein
MQWISFTRELGNLEIRNKKIPTTLGYWDSSDKICVMANTRHFIIRKLNKNVSFIFLNLQI